MSLSPALTASRPAEHRSSPSGFGLLAEPREGVAGFTLRGEADRGMEIGVFALFALGGFLPEAFSDGGLGFKSKHLEELVRHWPKKPKARAKARPQCYARG
jgi:hypothetical protein